MMDRLRDRPRDGAEARAGDLIRRIGAPRPLDGAALARIRARALAGRRRWPARLRASFALSLALLAAGAAAVVARVVAERPRPREAVTAARCETVRLAGAGGLRLALRGPGQLSIDPRGRSAMVLAGGRLAVDTGDGDAVIDAADVHVRLPRAALAEISLDDNLVEVAAYYGEATVEWRSAIVSVKEGTTWSLTGVRENRPRDEVDRALDGPLPQLCPTPAANLTGTDNGNGNGNGNGNDPIKPRKPRTAVAAPPVAAPPPPLPPPPAPVAPPLPPPPAESRVAAESRLLGEALHLLNQQHDPSGALAVLDRYDAAFPDGTLRADARTARVKALRALGKNGDALALLDGMQPAGEWLLARGELRAEAGRCRDAVADFDRALADGRLAERALWGRASCRSRDGDADGARADLAELVRRFPDGRLAAEARRALDR